MTEGKIAPQKVFATLDDFVRGMNNFYAYFLDDCDWGRNRRTRPVFKRFAVANPELERTVTRETTSVFRSLHGNFPYERLWDAYNLMSHLVYSYDKYALRNGVPDSLYLIR